MLYDSFQSTVFRWSHQRTRFTFHVGRTEIKRQFNCSLAANFAKATGASVWTDSRQKVIRLCWWTHLHVVNDLLEEAAEAAVAANFFDADIHDVFFFTFVHFSTLKSLFFGLVLYVLRTHALHSIIESRNILIFYLQLWRKERKKSSKHHSYHQLQIYH